VKNVGSPAWVFAVWIFGGVLSLFGALSSRSWRQALPEAGGEYVYLREAYGPFWGYLYGWTQMWVAKSGSIATLATGFSFMWQISVPNWKAYRRGATPDRGGGKPLEIITASCSP